MAAKTIRAALGLLALLAVLLPASAAAVPMTRQYVSNINIGGTIPRPEAITVDQSNGDVYVLDSGGQKVTRYNSSLQVKNFTGLSSSVIDGAGTLACAGVSANCDQTPFNGFSFSSPAGSQVAIDNSGNPLTNGDIYITDTGHRIVDIFAPSGVFIGTLSKSGVAGTAFGVVDGIAVDSSGAVYVADQTNSKIHKFVPTTNPPTNADFNADLVFSQPGELAFGAGSTAGSLFVNKRNGTVAKLTNAGTLQYQLSAAVGTGVAVDRSTGHAFVASGSEVTEYDASSVVSATALGGFGANQVATAAGIAIDGNSGRVYVSDSVNAKVDVYGPLTPVPAPTVALGPYSPRTDGGMGLAGFVNPGGVPTSYYFEYGISDCAGGGCTSVPVGRDGSVGKGIGMVRVSETVAGLGSGATYHYRLVATNSAGSVASPDATFSTLGALLPPQCGNASLRNAQGTQTLPDCRAYELVSAIPLAQRNSAEVMLNTERVRAAANGGAFQFSSYAGAADVGAVPYTADYMSVRDPGAGWSVHGLTPVQPGLTGTEVLYGRQARYIGEFAPDLSKAIFLAAAPVNNESPNVQEIFNLYLRTDALTPGPGSYRLLTDAATLQSPQTTGEDTELPTLVGVSTDLSHVVFESPRNLTASAALLGSGQRLYESVDGVVRLVGVLPATEGGGPTIAKGGQGGFNYSPHVVSADGSRVAFTAPMTGSTETAGALYMRDDHGTAGLADDSTVKISATEKTNGAGVGGADPRGAQPATFADASTDLGAVFFRSTEALTNDAPTDQTTAQKLYRYEAAAPSGSRLTLLSVDRNSFDGINDGVDGVIGASADGSYVYFVASNQLVADRPVPPISNTTPAAMPKIFVWHQGSIRQVGGINSGVETLRITGSNGWQVGGRWARVSPDGKHLLFISEGTAELGGYDHGSSCASLVSTRCKEAYLYSAPEAPGGERLLCTSCNPSGQPAAGDIDFNTHLDLAPILSYTIGDSYLNHPLSSDGGLTFFTSEERLSPYDENQSPDVYERDSANGSVSLLSGGRPGVASYFLDASADGRDVFFGTRSQLIGADVDGNVDVYDARVGGGFGEAGPPAAPCASASACRPANSAPAAELTPASLQPAPVSVRRQRAHRKHHRAKHKSRHGHRDGTGARNG
jgi:hypothetical protein